MKRITKIESFQPLTSNKIRVAAYCRVSSSMDAQLESLEAQKSHYEKYIQSRKEWTYVGLYYDEGITGTKMNKRPGLLRLIEDCNAHKIDFIITKSISRFSRNTADCLYLIRSLQKLEIPIYFESENINTQEMESELLLSILSTMAEGEVQSISENSKWGATKRFKMGSFKLSYAPFGFNVVNGNLEINKVEEPIVRRIYSSFLSGEGSLSIARALNEENIPTRKNKKWNSSTVLAILSNEKYTGSCIFQKTFTDSSYGKRKNNGELDKYYVENHHQGIISKSDFDKVQSLIEQKRIEKNIEKGSEKYQSRYSFSSKIICSECHSTFKRRIVKSKTSSYITWGCKTHLKDSTSCSMDYVRDEDLKRAFTTMINKLIFSHRTVLKPYLKALKENASDENSMRIKELETLLEENEKRRSTLSSLYSRELIDQVMFTKESNIIANESQVYKKEIEAIKNSESIETQVITKTEKLLHFCKESDMLLEFDENLFTSVVKNIEVYSKTSIGFVLYCGLTLKEEIS